MFQKNLINSVYQSISQLRYIDIDNKEKNNLEAVIKAYRGVFGNEYTKNMGEIVAKDVRRDIRDICGLISKDSNRSFYQFLSNHHCCWIDFIGSDFFSCNTKKQVFFSTVSMSREDVETRARFLNEYNRLLDAGYPVDIFVQLFFSDISRINDNEYLKTNTQKAPQIIQLLKQIQTLGLQVDFGSVGKCSEIVSTQIRCKPVENEADLLFEDISPAPSLDDEIVGFLNSLLEGNSVSPLVHKVALLNRSLHKQVNHLYFLPLHSPDGAIGLYCYGSKKLLSWKERRDLLVFSYSIMSPFVSAYKSAWENQQIIKESIKSAVSAIMSRNMSHNLGSHYLYYTKAHLESLANKNEDVGPDIRGVAKVLSYMQARMDYLATIISNDKYPNGSVNFKAQLFDELTIDDFSKRHFQLPEDISKRTTNFLLSNLILSENFTRSSILSNNQYCNPEEPHMLLRLQTMLWNSHSNIFDLFTGSALSAEDIKAIKIQNAGTHSSKLVSFKEEEAVKDELSRVNFAMPGGSMACHAFFNILENFIRNSAKYLQEDFNTEEGLVITIAIKRNEKDSSKFDILFFDNKQNANKVHETSAGDYKPLIQDINDQLSGLRILDESNGIEKSSKGLKEMLFSAVWMRTYTYPNQSFADVIDAIHREKKDKLQLINEYGFSVVPVSNDGIIRKEDTHANLGVMFTLPEFILLTKPDIDLRGDENEQINKCLGVYADIIELDSSHKTQNYSEKDSPEKVPIKLEDFFTRVFYSEQFDKAEYMEYVKNSSVSTSDDELSAIAYRYKMILDKRFCSDNDTIDSYTLKFGGAHFEKNGFPKVEEKCIYFQRHLNTTEKLERFKNYAYADSVSGGNMTITLSTLFESGIDERGHYKTWRDKILGYKIKESALTKITLIDERLFNNMNSLGASRELELALKRIRILNYNPKKINEANTLLDLFEGNAFLDGSNRTHFLSIHLGLIEKIVKSAPINNRFLSSTSLLEKRVTLFMQELKRIFSDRGQDVFIAVHSGRGNFSKELEGPLANYPFISLPAIENALSNSKYLLSQLFYNTAYIGKGRINKK